MPFYEYRCGECGHQMEALQKISDEPLVDCPECGQPALKKLVSAAGFRLKGGGWYETDFKKGQKKNLHESGNKKPGGTSGGDKKSSDSGTEKKKKESKSAGGSKS
jgi:putative FmdB family regulatory protein